MSTTWPTIAGQADAIDDLIFDRKTDLLSSFPGQASTINGNYANRPTDEDGFHAVILYATNLNIHPASAIDSLLLENVDAEHPFD